MVIGIYGGTFNPPHQGHYKVMETVIAQLGLERLLLIPTKTPPHKELPSGTPSEGERLFLLNAMADLLRFQQKQAKKSPCIVETLPLEFQREGKSFTVDTLKTLREQFPQDQFWLIMGEDLFLHFQDWHQAEEIAKMADICTFLRSDKEPSKALLSQAKEVQGTFGNEVRLLTLEGGVTASSTAIRADLEKQRFSPDLLPCIAGRILSQHSYGLSVSLAGLDLPLLRSVVWGEVKSKRVAHIKGVEEECIKLAKRWGEDETLARRAGILHDLTKYWSHQAHLDFCDKYGYPLEELERENEKLLHAKSGAVYAQEILKESPALCQAIACHTTGRKGMTKLDKILYLADYIEVNRDFPELETLRRLSYEDLDKAVGYGLYIALEEMKARGKVTHQDTLAGFEAYGKAHF